MEHRKVVIIGAGHVGSHCAYALAAAGDCEEIVLVDLLPEVSPAAEAVAEMSFLPEGRCLVWEEYGVSEDYSIAFCQYTAPISHNQPGTGHQYPAGQAAWER